MSGDSWPSDARRDRLIGDWHIYQRTGGHRTSTDDLITAWYAVHRSRGTPSRYLDLGCGIGSVLLLVSHRLAPPVSVGIEAQAQSVAMARRTAAELPPSESAISIAHGDIRETTESDAYDLITGSPPYFATAAGVLPRDPQRRACRFEERGGVEDYVSAAARWLRADGRFYVVFQTAFGERVTSAADAEGLFVTGQADFHMTVTRKDPFLSVYELARAPADSTHRFVCAVRDAGGAVTDEYRAIRLELGV